MPFHLLPCPGSDLPFVVRLQPEASLQLAKAAVCEWDELATQARLPWPADQLSDLVFLCFAFFLRTFFTSAAETETRRVGGGSVSARWSW